MLAAALALLVAIALLVDFELVVFAKEGAISSDDWVAENRTINAENYKKIRSTSQSPIIRTAGYAPPAPVPGRRRILVVGDSFIWGNGYSNINSIWWRQLQWELERRGYHGVDVVAAGMNGASTQDELGWLRRPGFIEAARPDLLVFDYVTNDPHMKDESGKDLVKQFVPPPIAPEVDNGRLLPTLRHELATRAARRSAMSPNDETGYPYETWELKILQGENFRRYRMVLKDLSSTIKAIGVPAFFVATPNFPDKEFFEERHAPVSVAFQEAGLEFIDLLPSLLRCCSRIATSVGWGINPANSHPGQQLAGFYAREVADIVQARFPAMLGPRSPGPSDATPAINDWMPASLGPRKTGGTEWTFEYPTDVTQLLRMPVGEPHVALNFERPVSIRRIQLTSRFASEFKVWATVLDGTDSHELKDYLEVGRGSGQELAVTLPFDVASARITSLRIAQRGAGPELETLVTLDPAMITPSTGLSFQYPVPQFVARADDSENHGRSTVAMLEDGKPLRPHSLHDDIRRLGGARFSHWKDYILFSSSDGSDPRRNGRRYTLATYGKGNEVTIQLSFDAPPVRP